MKQWIRNWIKRKFRLYDIDDLQCGGWCGCCGMWLPNEIVEKDFPWTLCPDWETNPRHAA